MCTCVSLIDMCELLCEREVGRCVCITCYISKLSQKDDTVLGEYTDCIAFEGAHPKRWNDGVGVA